MAVATIYAFWQLHQRVRPWNDFAFICAAGRTWLRGASPYDFAIWNAEWGAIRPAWTVVSQPMPYVYPPHWAPIAVLAALVPWPVASRAWDVVSVLSFAGTAVFSVKMLGPAATNAVRRPGVWASVAFAALNPGIRYSAGQSQTALFATFGVAGAFWAWHEKRVAWLAVFGFIASLKPQVSLAALTYLFLTGGHLGLFIGAAVAVTVGVLAMIPSGVANMPAQLAHGYSLHAHIAFNDPKVFSNLLAFFPWPGGSRQFLATSMATGLAASVALGVAARQARKRRAAMIPGPLWQLSILAAVTGTLMPVHAYDLVIYTPLVVLAYELRWRWVASLLIALSLFAARVAFLSAHVPIPQMGSYLTTAMVLTLAVGLILRGRHARPAVLPPPRIPTI